MELVLVERSFEEPVTFEEIEAIENASGWCFDTHNVRHVKTMFSRDRRRMLCLYNAPDVEAVRRAESEAKAPFQRAWSCSKYQSHSSVLGGAAGTETVVVERAFSEPVTRETLMEGYRLKGWCFETYSVNHVETYLGLDGLRMVCLFQAPDAEAVRMANRLGEVPFTEVWTASLYPPGA